MYTFLIYTYNVDIFIIVFIFSYCNIRYVVLSFGEIKTHYYLLLLCMSLAQFQV